MDAQDRGDRDGVADALTVLPADDGLDGLTWAELLWMGDILGDPERARESLSLTPSEARARYLDQLRQSEEYDQREAQEAEARAHAPDLPPTQQALHLMVADDSRRFAREARGRIRSIQIRSIHTLVSRPPASAAPTGRGAGARASPPPGAGRSHVAESRRPSLRRRRRP
jgi:hypothetical protein